MNDIKAPLPVLNPQSPIPLYRQLADILLGRIRSGEYCPGDRIPSETALSAFYGVGRPTVRQATDFLIRKSLLSRRRGSGTYVEAEQKEVDLFSLGGTISSFVKSGIEPDVRILKPVRSVYVEKSPDNPFSERRAYFMSRLSLIESTPVLIEDMYFMPELFPGLDKVGFEGRSVSRVADEVYYLRPGGGKQIFKVETPGGNRAALLDLDPGSPVLSVKRHIHFDRAQNAVYAELFCRTDKCVFMQSMGGTNHE